MKKTTIIIVLIVLAIIAFWILGDKPAEQTVETGNEATQTKPATTPQQTVKQTPKPVASTPIETRSYTQLVADYAGRRIQFDQYCQAVPSYVTYKSGTSIMLDNRSGDARYVKVGADEHYLAGYGYKIVTLVGNNTNVDISCGSAVNVGRILLQGNISNTQ